MHFFDTIETLFLRTNLLFMNDQIIIVGAGVSGLVAALQLEKEGYSPVIFESDYKVGGRVQSDVFDGYVLDKGFQVLLSAYPLAQKYLDYNSLTLKRFDAGSYIFKDKHRECIGDPLRDKSLFFATLFSGIGNFSDKLKVFRLNRMLNKKSIEQIFKDQETTTLSYLQNFGFSASIINDFFGPFFTGIFLETKLETSSRMFEFIFKMFGEGEAVVPERGIQEIPNQLAAKLKKTTINFNKKVSQIVNNRITFDDNTTEAFKYCIVATEASNIIPNLSNSEIQWKSTQTLYFEVDKKAVFNKNMIGLLANEPNALINSLCFPFTEKKEAKLLSVTIIKEHTNSEFELITIIKKELKKYFNLEVLKYLKTYSIKKALPNLNDVKYEVHPSETQLTESIFLAGDTILNGSLNGAMLSGEIAAKAVHEKNIGTILK